MVGLAGSWLLCLPDFQQYSQQAMTEVPSALLSLSLLTLYLKEREQLGARVLTSFAIGVLCAAAIAVRYANIVFIIPGFVLLGIVEDHPFSFFPVTGFPTDSDAAIFGILRNHQSQMEPQNAFKWARMGWNVFTRREYREHRCPHPGNLI